MSEALIEKFSRQNAIAGVAIFVPGADFPVLTLNQIRLVLRLAAAHGVEVDQDRWPEVLATIGAALGFRAVARQLLGAIPVAGWLVKGTVAYAGTRAVGEAAHRYFHSVAGKNFRVRWCGREAAAFRVLRDTGSAPRIPRPAPTERAVRAGS